MLRNPIERATVSGIGRAALNWLLPSFCPSCRILVASGDGFCMQCWSRLNWIERPYCERLGIPFAYDIGSGALSAEAIANPPPFGRARAAVLYDERVQRVIHRFKYLDQPELSHFLGPMLLRAAGDLLAHADLIVPVPLHRRRLWQRRYNQSAELARTLGCLSGIAVDFDGFERIKPTIRQVGLVARDRKRNVQGAFRVTDNGRASFFGKSVLLVDDVLTTGATVDACTRALLRGGCRSVDVVTFARVAAPGGSPI
ncbi:ComF family protein [Coralliovum pocilloporae]|uniref:ComF family protein n=1 Tax=Coralliovum pocilloporae TaxID=3066369 RepID=UPI0033071341